MVSQTDRLRLEARKRQKAATDKISRLRRNAGIEVAGSEFDPRVSSTTISNANAAQLRAHIRKLNAFTSRDTQFHAGAGGTPLPRKEWDAYKRLEARRNRQVAAHVRAVENVKLPDQDRTIGQREFVRTDPRMVRAKGEPTYRPMSPQSYEPHHIEGVAGLRTLTEDVKRKLKKTYLPDAIAKQRDSARQMFDLIGNPELSRKFDELTDFQFNALWNYNPDFTRDLSHYYFMQKAGMEASQETRQKWMDQAEESYESGINSGLSWAKTVKAAKQKNAK